nr:TPA_asm: NADH dehydrogenase subunit 6 [Pseudomyrmex concolor]
MNKLNFLMLTSLLLMSLLIMLIMFNKIHPIYLIINIVLYSILLSTKLSLMKKTYMYSIMLFLIMISGVLIIFLYFASLISNEKMINLKWMKLMYSVMVSLVITLYTWSLYYSFYPISECMEIKSINQIQQSMFNNLKLIYTYPFNSVSILCMMFLLISMLSIIKIISWKSAPLRKIN